MSPQMVRIKWLDSGLSISDGWQKTSEVLEDASLSKMTVTSVGMLMHEDDDMVILGLSRDEEHDAWFSAQVIARQNILERKVLR